MKPHALLLGCAVGAVALSPAAAAAKTKQVSMGLPVKYQKTFFEKHQGDANAFFPAKVTIARGDKVRFTVNGFHNIDFPAAGASALPLVLPTGEKIAGEKDAAGQDFWFNGLDQLAFNPELAPVGFGKTFTYTGAARVKSGLPVIDNPRPVSVKFPKAGTFTYFCSIHPGMTGKVRVVKKRGAVPSSKADARAVRKQATTALNTLEAVNKKTVGAEIVQIGGAGEGGVESFRFFPPAPEVKVGTTLTFTMPPGSTELHTATTGPGNPESEEESYLGTVAAGYQSQVFPGVSVYPSDTPGETAASLTPTLHGNGFWNSGALDRDENSPVPSSNKVTFAAAGSYTFYCLVHPFMKATVTVTP